MALAHTEQIDQLFSAILSLKNLDECYQYFEDLFTIKETLTFAQRQEVAGMLAEGQSYQKTIADQLRANGIRGHGGADPPGGAA